MTHAEIVFEFLPPAARAVVLAGLSSPLGLCHRVTVEQIMTMTTGRRPIRFLRWVIWQDLVASGVAPSVIQVARWWRSHHSTVLNGLEKLAEAQRSIPRK